MMIIILYHDNQFACVRVRVASTNNPGDKFGTVVVEDPTPYAILALWAVNGPSVICWE